MNLDTAQNKNPEKILKSLHEQALKYFQLPEFDTFKEHMQNDQDKLLSFSRAMGGYYTMPNLDQLKSDIGFIEKKKEDDTSGEDLQLPSYQTLTDYVTDSVDGKTPKFGPESITYKIPKWAKSTRLKELEEKQFSPEQVQTIKDTYYDLDTPKKLDSISRLIDQDFAILDDGIKNANQINSYLQDEEKRIEQQIELLGDQPYPEKLNRQIEEYNKIIEENKAADNKMKQFKDQLEAKVFSIEAATANILSEKSKEGSPLGAMYNSFMMGVGSEASGAVDLMIDGMTYFSPRNGLSPKTYDRLKSEGKSEDEILDYARKYSKKQLLPEIRKGALEFAGVSSTTQEYMNKWEQTFFGGAFSGLAKSLPEMIGNKYTRILGFGLQASDAVSKEMENNPDFDGISETEKYAVKLPIAVINGVLENYGFRNIVNGSSLTKTVLSNILKTKSKKITAKTFTELADREIKSLLAKGAIRIGTGGLAEFETGALQEISDVTVKSLYNGVKDKKMFETPGSLTDFASQVLRSGAQEAIGGFVMATVPAALNGIRERKGYKLEQKLFDIIDDYVQNPEMIIYHEMQQRIALKKGAITKEEYDKNKKNLDYFKSISSKIPKNISPESRKESFDLLRERESLNEQKKGVDESMTAPFEERITEINNRLTEISKTAKTEEQQEQQPERKKKAPGRKRSYKKGMSPSLIDRGPYLMNEENEKSDILNRADNAEAALKDVGDGTRVFVYETQEDMVSSVPEADTDTKAIYVNKDNTIHIALDVATNDDVGHEAFHAAVLNAIKSDTELQALTKRMLDAVLTTKEGKEIYSDIQDLLTNYEESVQNEEALANILGKLSANYDKLTPSVKTQILQWINSVAKKLNLGTVFTDAATDAEVIDVLNRFQQKVTEGKRVDTKELEVLSEKINETAKPTGNKVNNLKDKPRKSILVDLGIKRHKGVESKVKDATIADIANKTVHLTFSDRLVGGFVQGKEYLGGILFPAITNSVWAANKKTSGSRIINSAVKNDDGYRYVTIAFGSTESHMSNNNMLSEAINLVEKSISQENISTEDAYKRVLKALSVKDTKSFKDEFTSLAEAKNAKSIADAIRKTIGSDNSTFEQRKSFLNTLLGNAKVPKNKFGNLPNFTELANELSEPLSVGHDYGDVISYVRTKGDLSLEEAKPGDPDYHPSYKFVIRSTEDVELLLLDKAYSAKDLFPFISSKNVGYENYVEKYGDQAKAKYLNWLGGGQMSTNVSEQVSEQAEPARVRKSKLTKEEQESLDRGNSIRKKNDQALKNTKQGFKTQMVKFLKNVFGEQLTDSQTSIKRIYEGYDTLSKQNRVLNKIVNIAGAKGYATDVFQEYEEEILGGLKKSEISLLEMIVLSRRIIEINRNRLSRDGKKFKEYTGTDGYNTKESEAYLKSLSKDNPELFKKLNDRASKYFDMSRQMLKEMYDGGLLTSESYESIRQLEYMPIKTLKFVLENETENWSEDDIDSFSEKLGISSNGIMTLTENNERNIVQDLRYMMMLQVNMTKFRVAQNELLNAVYDDYVSRDNKEDFNEFILDNPVVGKKTNGALKFKYDNAKIPLGYKQISFFKNGIKYKMVMKKEARNQLLNLKAKSLNPTMKSLLRLGSFSPILRFFATAANPLFVLSNIPMDYQNILLNSNIYGRSALYGSLPLAKDFTLNFLRKIANTGEYRRIKREYFENGGKMLFMAEQANLTQKDIDKAKKFAKPFYSLVNYYGKAFGYLGDASELAFRLAVYERTKSKEISKFKKENGKLPSPEQLQDIKETATREAREVMDYNQGGRFSKALDLVMPYTNASFLGLRRFYDGARKNPKIFAYKVVEMMAATAILQTYSLSRALLAFDGDEEEKKRKLKDALKGLSEYERANYFVIFTGKKNKKGELEYHRIRKLPLLNVAFSVSEQIVEQVMLGKEFDYWQSFKVLRWSVPFFGGGRVESTVPVLAAKSAILDNKDVFYDQDIWRGEKDIPEYKKGLYDEKVEGIYKQIGEKMNLSPKKLKVAMEKIVTTPTTNPGLAIFYSVANGIVTKESDELKNLPKILGENSLKKFKRYTNSNLKRYKAKEEMTDQLIKAKGDEYSKDQEIKMMIRDEMSKEKPNYESFISKLESEIIKKYPADKYDQENKRQRFVKYINMEQNAEKGAQRVPYEVIDLFYEREIESQLIHLKYIYDNVSGGDPKEFVRYMNNAKELLDKSLPVKAIKVFLRDYK
jgi:hypothetical protein